LATIDGDGGTLPGAGLVHEERLQPAGRAALLRAYLERWKWEVGAFFDGVGPEDELRRIGPDHPAFRIES